MMSLSQMFAIAMKQLILRKSKELTLFKLVEEETTLCIYLLRAKHSGVDLMLWANLAFLPSL